MRVLVQQKDRNRYRWILIWKVIEKQDGEGFTGVPATITECDNKCY